MLRKVFAVLLIASLVILSGVDLLEDLDLPQQVSIDNPENESQPNGSPGFDLVHNVLQFGDLAKLSCFTFWQLPNCTSLYERPTVRNKLFKLHKLNRVFLI